MADHTNCRGNTNRSRQGPASPKTTSLFIETRIEQAMELVKSHLVHAVREEMDCMRDTIVQLKMRVSQLEQENAALRSSVNNSKPRRYSAVSRCT